MIGEPLFAVVLITIALDIIIRAITDDFIGNNPARLGRRGVPTWCRSGPD